MLLSYVKNNSNGHSIIWETHHRGKDVVVDFEPVEMTETFYSQIYVGF